MQDARKTHKNSGFTASVHTRQGGVLVCLVSASGSIFVNEQLALTAKQAECKVYYPLSGKANLNKINCQKRKKSMVLQTSCTHNFTSHDCSKYYLTDAFLM